jgi:ethanolamine phosphate phosphodiesterase
MFDICNFDLVLLDTSSLLNTVSPEIYEPPSNFLNEVSNSRTPYVRLLFSHIPLYRPPDTYCGPYRESSLSIRVGAGYQYQNTLDVDLTSRILDSIWPVMGVFSGDDHDSCVINHVLEGRNEEVPEYTVKSFSWAMVFVQFDLTRFNLFRE